MLPPGRGKLRQALRNIPNLPHASGWVPALEFLLDTPVDPGGPVNGLRSGSRGVPGDCTCTTTPFPPDPQVNCKSHRPKWCTPFWSPARSKMEGDRLQNGVPLGAVFVSRQWGPIGLPVRRTNLAMLLGLAFYHVLGAAMVDFWADVWLPMDLSTVSRNRPT